MTFLVPCPNCGLRSAEEFAFGGESSKRPRPGEPALALSRYLYYRVNSAGPEVEWWYHRDGCQEWFLAVRDTRTNAFQTSYLPADRPAPDATEKGTEARAADDLAQAP
jgi:sarcosine oxidase subunit alpha